MGRCIALGVTCGVAGTQLLANLFSPYRLTLFLALLFGGIAIFVRKNVDRRWLLILIFLAAFTFGTMWAIFRANLRLEDGVADKFENYVTRLSIQIVSLVQDDGESFRFTANVIDDKPQGVPERIQINWQKSDQITELWPGQTWRAALLLRRPAGLINPYGFDYEALAFARGVRAIGRVRGIPKLLSAGHPVGLHIRIERLRQHIRHQMRRALGDSRYAPVMIALAIGDQNSVSMQDWRVFNITGITHLVRTKCIIYLSLI